MKKIVSHFNSFLRFIGSPGESGPPGLTGLTGAKGGRGEPGQKMCRKIKLNAQFKPILASIDIFNVRRRKYFDI